MAATRQRGHSGGDDLSGARVMTAMDILRSQGDIGTPYREHHWGLGLEASASASSLQAFPRHTRGGGAAAPVAQALYPSMRQASFFTSSNTHTLSFASLDDDARYWSSPRRGFKFYRHERRTTAAEAAQQPPCDTLALDTDTSFKAGVARRVADQTPYAQYGAMRSAVARLPKSKTGGASDILTSTPHAVGPGSYEHGIPRSEPFMLQRRPSCIFQSTTPRMGTFAGRGEGAGEPVYASVSMDRAHWKPRFKGAGKFGTGKRPPMVLPGGDTPGPGAHDGAGTSRWPQQIPAKAKLQLGGFRADLPRPPSKR
eukprot:CAMPEP_0181360500 /NCGR_PEP_ID=MMETSP1106-20121128/6705_1 /TAXON_ID=81844 /ORGANISM="Mantoniella antarctica, Strain SL-175" /LENGTH=311 /DNA_ID=CAMNT_0023473789 /DNA_START=30 /DNA_END=965 /DNA_ORIENTATION=-